MIVANLEGDWSEICKSSCAYSDLKCTKTVWWPSSTHTRWRSSQCFAEFRAGYRGSFVAQMGWEGRGEKDKWSGIDGMGKEARKGKKDRQRGRGGGEEKRQKGTFSLVGECHRHPCCTDWTLLSVTHSCILTALSKSTFSCSTDCMPQTLLGSLQRSPRPPSWI